VDQTRPGSGQRAAQVGNQADQADLQEGNVGGHAVLKAITLQII